MPERQEGGADAWIKPDASLAAAVELSMAPTPMPGGTRFFLTVKCVFGWLSLEVWLQVRMVGFYDCMVYHRITIKKSQIFNRITIGLP